MKVFRSERAAEDLLDAWAYIAVDHEGAADALLDHIESCCERIAEFPYAGRAREELGTGIRSLPAGPFILFYRVAQDGIEIIRVLHGSRDLDGEW